jgi:flagellar basal body-associated protein FliL
MNKKSIVILIIIAAVAISIGLYTIPPLFTNTVIDEPLPATSGLNIRALSIDSLINEKVNEN